MKKHTDIKIDKGRRDALKTAGLFVAAVVGSSLINKIDAASTLGDIAEGGQQQQRIVRKAVYVPKNCKIHKQIASKAKNPEQCNLCVDVCPKKCITAVEVKGGKGLKEPKLDESSCIGCGRCWRVCPEEPKAWEIWDRTNNQKLR